MYQYTCNHLPATATNPRGALTNESELPSCVECDEGENPNSWICLYPNCLQVYCGEKSNDHSTTHYNDNSSHCIHMNLFSKRLWCYECKHEVYILEPRTEGATSSTPDDSHHYHHNKSTNDFAYSSLRTSSPERSMFAFEKTVGLNVGMSGDASESDDELSQSGSDVKIRHDRPYGLVGLQNIGNTCYMNSALQALSNAVPLTRFFLECATTVQILSEGKKPGLSRTYQALVRDVWRKNGGYVTPSGILYGIRSVHPMFRGFYQHDTQEFLRNFMDQLHEELKQPVLYDIGIYNDSDTFSLAMDEPTVSSSYDSSEGEYETCDSGVSERSSLSDDTERATTGGLSSKRRLSTSTSPERRRLRTRLQSNANVIDSQPSSTTTTTPHLTNTNPPATIKRQPHHHRFRSIISDVFDGKLLSSVQCLTCDRISSRVETFQDLSLPIPSRDHLVVLHGRPPAPGATCTDALIPANEGWIAWLLAWLKSWFYGPLVTLHDCLAAFFSTDELKGDNMYSCEKCNKLRNGIKFSKVLQLPEVLCIHLKRFRHELMFSSKISAAVSFPLKGLEMRPYLHADCVSKVTTYELFSVICHYGTAGGGHYICYALNGGQWYEFDDQYVTRVSPEKVQTCEAYVLFYRKVQQSADEIRNKAVKMAKNHTGPLAHVSKQWLSRFYTCAEPGPIDNSDFLCQHGSINPDRELQLAKLALPLPIPVYDYLFKKFGGCAPISNAIICPICQALDKRLLNEMERFVELTREAKALNTPGTHFISTAWYAQWHKFMQKTKQEPPGPIDNSKINLHDANECAEIPESIWLFFYNIYGGGPELRVTQRLENNVDSERESSENEEHVVEAPPHFVIPKLRARENGEKSVYCSGEPMEVVESESEPLFNGFDESPKDGAGTSSDAPPLTNGVHTVDNDVTSDDDLNEIKNSKRHRRRRKAVASV